MLPRPLLYDRSYKVLRQVVRKTTLGHTPACIACGAVTRAPFGYSIVVCTATCAGIFADALR